MVVGSPDGMAFEDDADVCVSRSSANVWWLVVGDQRPARALKASGSTGSAMPSTVLAAAAHLDQDGNCASSGVVGKVELDVCGAWLTVANTGGARPVLVRRAGWVELRGHPDPPPDQGADWSFADDRIGLGPADMLVLLAEAHDDPDHGRGGDELFDLALRGAGTDPVDLARLLSQGDRPLRGITVGVPGSLGTNPLQRVATATGVSPDEVQSPGYPLGDLQPDLWKEPPAPPRAARLRLTQDRASVGAVRSLLDRLVSSWRLDGRVDDGDLKLIATELSANAVVHTNFPDTVTVRYLGDRIRIEVRDTSAAAPQRREAGPQAEGGRGMRMVEALASSWGVEPTVHGKQVWCEVAVS